MIVDRAAFKQDLQSIARLDRGRGAKIPLASFLDPLPRELIELPLLFPSTQGRRGGRGLSRMPSPCIQLRPFCVSLASLANLHTCLGVRPCLISSLRLLCSCGKTAARLLPLALEGSAAMVGTPDHTPRD